MGLPSFWDHTVTVEQAELVDDVDGSNYGNQTLDWAGASSTVCDGVFVQPVPAAEELSSGRDTVLTRWRLMMPNDVAGALPAGALQATDRVVYGGDTYDIDGRPEAWPSASGDLDHVEVFLVRSDG